MMPRPRKRTILIAAALFVTALLIYYMTARLVPDRAAGLLAAHGFTTAALGKPSFHGDSFALADIALDDHRFSTIRALRIQPRWNAPFSSHFIRGLIVDDMRLLGEWQDGRLDIAGWAPRLPPYPRQDDIIVNGLRLDLDTVHGAIRLETKGRLTRTADGSYKVDGVLYGRQHQLTLDSRWIGGFDRSGAYAFEGEIAEATIRTDRLDASRVSGWLQIAAEETDNSKLTLPAVAGQIQMGRLAINDVPLSNANITIDGPAGAPRLILTAEVAGLSGMHVNADFTRAGYGWHVKATVSTAQLQDMIAFMLMLRKNLESHGSNTLTRFLITPGNMERLRRAVSAVSYDVLELQIEGPLDALHGSLITKKQGGGNSDRHAISLDPG